MLFHTMKGVRVLHLLAKPPLRARRYSSSFGSSSPPLRKNRFRRILTFSAFSVLFTSAGFLLATAPAIASIATLMSAPSDAESVAMYRAPDQAAAEINKFLVNHPLSIALRADPAWSESRPHLRYPEAYREHSLTAGTLIGPTTVPVPPLVFTDQKHLVWMCYLSTGLCGHVGIVHGGMLATILDEGLGRCSFASLPNHIGVTASLTVNYRKPVPAGSFVVLKAETTKAEGRKAWVKGRIEILNQDETPGTVLAEAEALFLEPKFASSLPRLFQP